MRALRTTRSQQFGGLRFETHHQHRLRIGSPQQSPALRKQHSHAIDVQRRPFAVEVLGDLGLGDDPLFKLAMALEKIALEDDYFVQRKLYPNVDFYSGIVQRALGIPESLFTAIFSLARTVGWIAQWNEMISDPDQKIGRPRQLYTGAVRRDVPPIAKRRAA